MKCGKENPSVAGNQFFDIVRIMCAYCDAEVRREAELTLVDDYYATLMEHMLKDGRTVDFRVEQVVANKIRKKVSAG